MKNLLYVRVTHSWMDTENTFHNATTVDRVCVGVEMHR